MLYVSSSKLRQKKGDQKSLESKLKAASWCAFSAKNIWNGILPTALGSFHYQLEGNKCISLVNTSEILEVPLANIIMDVGMKMNLGSE